MNTTTPGLEKTALFLNGLPPNTAQNLLQRMNPTEASHIRIEMKRLSRPTPGQIRQTIAEFLTSIQTETTKEPNKTTTISACHTDNHPSPSTNRPPLQNPVNSESGTPTQHSTINARRTNGNYLPSTPNHLTSPIGHPSGNIPQPHFDCYDSHEPTQHHHINHQPATTSHQSQTTNTPFPFLHTLSPIQIHELLFTESCPVIALILAHLPPDLAGQVLKQYPAEEQRDLLSRIAGLEETDIDVLSDIAGTLQERLEEHRRHADNRHRIKGAEAARAMLQSIDPETRSHIFNIDSRLAEMRHPAAGYTREIFQTTTGKDKTLSEQTIIQSSFENLQHFNDHNLAQLFNSVDPQTVLSALYGAPKPLIDKVVRYFTPEQEQTMQQQLQQQGTPPPDAVLQARKKILQIAEGRRQATGGRHQE